MRDGHVVLPSYMEGEMFPLCLMGGWHLGFLQLARVGLEFPKLLWTERRGILVEPRDEIGLASAIERFLTEPAFYARAGKNAIDRVHANLLGAV
jgi:glycosyltransferase involved in cell wall biosynthesis